jgi:hypothetical protein
MKHATPEKILREIITRLTRLEKAVFGKNGKHVAARRQENFSGPSGGVRLLVSRNFFSTKKAFGEVRTALAKHGL